MEVGTGIKVCGPWAMTLEARIPNFAQISFLITVHFTPSDDLLLKGAKQVWMGAAHGLLSCADHNGLLG